MVSGFTFSAYIYPTSGLSLGNKLDLAGIVKAFARDVVRLIMVALTFSPSL